jgi:hypothetical protein
MVDCWYQKHHGWHGIQTLQQNKCDGRNIHHNWWHILTRFQFSLSSFTGNLMVALLIQQQT